MVDDDESAEPSHSSPWYRLGGFAKHTSPSPELPERERSLTVLNEHLVAEVLAGENDQIRATLEKDEAERESCAGLEVENAVLRRKAAALRRVLEVALAESHSLNQ